jgi:hypothetical protein
MVRENLNYHLSCLLIDGEKSGSFVIAHLFAKPSASAILHLSTP